MLQMMVGGHFDKYDNACSLSRQIRPKSREESLTNDIRLVHKPRISKHHGSEDAKERKVRDQRAEVDVDSRTYPLCLSQMMRDGQQPSYQRYLRQKAVAKDDVSTEVKKIRGKRRSRGNWNSKVWG